MFWFGVCCFGFGGGFLVLFLFFQKEEGNIFVIPILGRVAEQRLFYHKASQYAALPPH